MRPINLPGSLSTDDRQVALLVRVGGFVLRSESCTSDPHMLVSAILSLGDALLLVILRLPPMRTFLGFEGFLRTESMNMYQETEDHEMVPLPTAISKEGHIKLICPKAFADSQADCVKSAQLITDRVIAISLPSLSTFRYDQILTTPT